MPKKHGFGLTIDMENKAQIKKAIGVLLKRYDLINAWRLVFPFWLVDIIFSFIFSVFFLWIALSVSVFLNFDCLWSYNQYLICWFSNYPLKIFFILFLTVFIARVLFKYSLKNLYTQLFKIYLPLIWLFPRLIRLHARLVKYNIERKNIKKITFHWHLIKIPKYSVIKKINDFFDIIKSKFFWSLVYKELLGFKLVYFVILIFLLFQFYFNNFPSLYLIIIVILVAIPLFKTFDNNLFLFDINIFLPRIIITISYVWITLVFTEESTSYLSNLGNRIYIIVVLSGLFGSIFLLFNNAWQNAPSVKKTHIFMYRVLPILAYSVFISVLVGLIFEFSGNDGNKYSHIDESIIFKDSIFTLNNCVEDLEDLEKLKTELKTDWYSLPDIPMDVNLKKKESIDYYYSDTYNSKLEYIKSNIKYYNALLDTFRLKDSLTIKIIKVNTLEFDTIPGVINKTNQLIDSTSNVWIENNKRFINEFMKQDSMLFKLSNTYNSRIDSLNSNDNKSLSILHKVSGFNFLKTKDHIDCACFFKTEINSFFKEQKIDSILYLTDFPLKIKKSEKNSDNIPFSFNLKRFLIEVVIAVTIGVIGQSLIGGKAGNESV